MSRVTSISTGKAYGLARVCHGRTFGDDVLRDAARFRLDALFDPGLDLAPHGRLFRIDESGRLGHLAFLAQLLRLEAQPVRLVPKRFQVVGQGRESRIHPPQGLQRDAEIRIRGGVILPGFLVARVQDDVSGRLLGLQAMVMVKIRIWMEAPI